LLVGLVEFFERAMNGFCGPGFAARRCSLRRLGYFKKLVIEPLRLFLELLRQSLIAVDGWGVLWGAMFRMPSRRAARG
jgi:hypothetical protein